MPLGIREERVFRKAFNRYLRTLTELNFENPEDLAAIMATAEVLTTMTKVGVRA